MAISIEYQKWIVALFGKSYEQLKVTSNWWRQQQQRKHRMMTVDISYLNASGHTFQHFMQNHLLSWSYRRCIMFFYWSIDITVKMVYVRPRSAFFIVFNIEQRMKRRKNKKNAFMKMEIRWNELSSLRRNPLCL